MEQLLRSQEAPALDQEQPVAFFPVRHHSPACAYHLQKAIEAYKPTCILIEGPENAQELAPVLAHPDTKAPVALYYFYRDLKGLLGEEKADYKCYYPFLDCSPELVALREARKRDIPARFMDLPYGEILLGTAENTGVRKEGEKQTYNDDYLLSRGRYLELLCEKTGLRSFAEFWEKYFEIGGLYLDTEAFIRQMLTYCGLSRQHSPREELRKEGCLLREQYMAWQIAQASKEHQRVLAVTGGFHTYGLWELLEKRESQEGSFLFYTGEPVKLHHLSKEEQGVYPLSYSMEAADALNGYASGMPSPGFYQRVWECLWEQEEPKGAYRKAVLEQLVRAGRQARQKKENISSYDEICALSMARGLAVLRGKEEPGLYELQDAALSSFVKGECTLSTDMPLRILQELNRGRQVGKLMEGALRPPILEDFERQCKKFGLKIQASARQEITLELFTKKKHLAASRFLYQMEFLETEFAKRKKGADLLNRRDRSRIREVWTYGFSSHVLSVLVDVSMSGGTVEEAARSRINSYFRKSVSSRDAAKLLTQGFLMGFLEEQAQMGMQLKQVLATDGDFFSLAEAFSHMRMLYELQELYQVKAFLELRELLESCFQKIIQLLPSMGQVDKEREQACMESCLSLYQITGKKDFRMLRPVLAEAFARLLQQKSVCPGLEGAVLGLLYGYESSWEERIFVAASGYLRSAQEQQLNSASFLRGLFYTARDFVFVGERFLIMIDGLLGNLEPEAFLRLLPELRRAFSYFTPLETDRIARQAAALHGASKEKLLGGLVVSPLEYAYGEELDAYARKRMEEWI
ncbi:MAG: Tim10/DDP family zinc finger protein [Lachnospiraceae bacterium]|nr:Tim10/DDP family zinc finger protein [Lachnospiraceae bacterium]